MAERVVLAPDEQVTASSPRLPARILLAVLRFYQLGISPLFGPSCRYAPTCSEYAREAVQVHGSLRGSWLALRRLLRCHPFHAGGYDPVPAPRRRRADHVGRRPVGELADTPHGPETSSKEAGECLC